MLGKALVVGANPVPVFDILAGIASDGLMVQRIGAIYGTDFSLKNAQGMVLEILRAWGLMAAAEYGLHLAADLLRTVTLGTSTVLTALPQGLAAACIDRDTPLANVLAREERSQVRAGLRRLKRTDRATLTAFYIDGQSLVEMSDQFAAPVGTIKRRLHVARKRLAKELEELATV